MNPQQMIEAHAEAFARMDWEAVSAYWHPDGELVSPSGRWPVSAMPSIMRDLGQHYEDVEITVSNVFGSPDGTYIGLEWTYASTRKSDGQRSVTPDAIIVEMHDGLIRSWREYFDLSTSVEFGMPPAAESERLDAAHDG